VKRNSVPETRTSNGGKLPSFVREGLEAHWRATAKVKASALKELGKPRRDRTILSAIKSKQVLRFKYNGKERIVGPQTYGISIALGKCCRRAKLAGKVVQVRCEWRNFSIWKRFRICEKRELPSQEPCQRIILTTAQWWKSSRPFPSRRND
jgi:hypothetical protein